MSIERYLVIYGNVIKEWFIIFYLLVDVVDDGDTSQEEEDSVGDNRLLQEMFDFLLSVSLSYS